MRVVPVSLGERSYKILVGGSLLDRLGRECARLGMGRRCAVITDSNVGPLHGARAMESLRAAGFDPVLVTIPAGERSKRWQVVARCHDELAQARLERRSFVVALGGGVVGDLAGFVAATYLRGVAFVQVPTTLLAQVDSSVGGKVGINLKAGKNLVGAFHQPRLVLCDLDALGTLPAREFQSGIAEVIKYGVIADAAMFRRLERGMPRLLARDAAELAWVVARSCAVKAWVVGQDETESGLRAILNFGHTVGHALEAISAYGKWLHGEAISVGQVVASQLSVATQGMPQADADRVRALLERAGLPVETRLAKAQATRLAAAMQLDKKVVGGEVRFVLARRIGEVTWGQAVPIDRVLGLMLPSRADAGTTGSE
ncbi:MAG: 3-dehydroquinate synthase [Verrucomicrobiota bacterium]|jgi:3-dehydroquinate synthase